MAQPSLQRPPYILWRLDRWKIGIAVVLLLLLLTWRQGWVGLPPPQATPGPPSPATPVSQAGASFPLGPAHIGSTTTLEEALPAPQPGAQPTVAAASEATGPSESASGFSLSVLGEPVPPLPINTPLLYGHADAGAEIEIEAGADSERTRADPEGRWQLALTNPLPLGLTWLRARQTEPGAGVTAVVRSVVVSVAPGALSMSPPVITPPLLPGPLLNSTPVVSGAGPPGQRLQLTDRSPEGDSPTLIGETLVDEMGRWRILPSQPLTAGKHELRAVIVSGNGRPLTRSWPQDIVISPEATPHQPPEVVPFVEPTAPPGGSEGQEGVVEAPVITGLFGRARPASRLFIYVDGVFVGETEADAEAAWRFTFETPIEGSGHDIRVVEVDAEGRPVAISAPPLLPVTGAAAH